MISARVYTPSGDFVPVTFDPDQFILPELQSHLPHHDFLFDGRMIKERDTPRAIQLINDDVIDAFPRDTSAPALHKGKFLQYLGEIGLI